MTTASRAMNWVYWAIAVALIHGVLVWWSMANASDRLWAMEGGGKTLLESIAETLVIVLNFPTIIICRALGTPPLTFAKPLVLLANSCLWGICASLILKVFTRRRHATA